MRAESGAGGTSLPSLNDGGGRVDLNSVQFSSDSLKARIKQTMLDQEAVFMGQVCELHRLYKVQTAMKEEFKQRASDRHNSHVDGVSSRPIQLNNQVNCSMNDSQIRAPGFKQEPLDLQLSADDFIQQTVNDISEKEALRGFPIDLNNSFDDRLSFDLNSPLRVDEDTGNNNVDRRISSDISISNSFLKDEHKLETLPLIDKPNLQSFSRSGTSHVYHGTTSTRPFTDAGLASKRQISGETDILAADTSVSRRTVKLDLNTVELEDFSYISNIHSGVVNPVATSLRNNSTHTVNNCAETVTPCVHLRGDGGKLGGDGKPEVIDLVSDSDEHVCNSGEPKTSVGSTSKLSNELSSEIEIEKGPKTSVLSSESECMIEHQACSTKIMQSGVNVRDSNLTSSNESQVVDLVPERPSDNCDVDIHCISSEEAADLLVQTSHHRQTDEYLEGSVKLNSKVSEHKEEEEEDGPQCSLDSYEKMVLNAKNCSPEDYCISSDAFTVKESENSKKRDNRYKLKRGTRMKDFQKDILSSLSTLSRNEIREDINFFEGVLKSRECKRTRTKIIDEGDWCRATRRKRSRLNRR